MSISISVIQELYECVWSCFSINFLTTMKETVYTICFVFMVLFYKYTTNRTTFHVFSGGHLIMRICLPNNKISLHLYFRIRLFIGHTRKISIPNCVEFEMTTNACRGFCVSYAVPSSDDTMSVNPKQAITAVGQCCNIMETEDVSIKSCFNVLSSAAAIVHFTSFCTDVTCLSL